MSESNAMTHPDYNGILHASSHEARCLYRLLYPLSFGGRPYPYSVSISFILQWCDIYFSNIAIHGSKKLRLMFSRLHALC